MKNEEEIFRKRAEELAKQSYEQGRYTFTNFMNQAQTDLFLQEAEKQKFISYSLWGGNQHCERQIGRFGCADVLGYEQDFPLSCIRIAPLLKKFSDDLSHRDFLGALMNLGIRRDALGDIFVEDREAYLFCTDTVAQFILDNLTKVRHTSVKCEKTEGYEGAGEEDTKLCEVTVSSERIDGVVSKVYGFSRTWGQELFREKRIYVNSRLCEENSRLLKNGDMVTVRGFGRFKYIGAQGQTRKDRWRVRVVRYGLRNEK